MGCFRRFCQFEHNLSTCEWSFSNNKMPWKSRRDPALKKCVIPNPYTVTVPIDQNAQFLLLASSGLWEVLSEREAVCLVTQVLTCPKRCFLLLLWTSTIFLFGQTPCKCTCLFESEIAVATTAFIFGEDTGIVHACLFNSVGCPHRGERRKWQLFLLFLFLVTFKMCHSGPPISVNFPRKCELFLNARFTSWILPHFPFSEDETQSDTVGPSQLVEQFSREETWWKALAQDTAAELVKAATQAGAKDKITVIVVLLSGSKMLHRNGWCQETCEFQERWSKSAILNLSVSFYRWMQWFFWAVTSCYVGCFGANQNPR